MASKITGSLKRDSDKLRGRRGMVASGAGIQKISQQIKKGNTICICCNYECSLDAGKELEKQD